MTEKGSERAPSRAPANGGGDTPRWTEAAARRLLRVPEGFMRTASRGLVETYAREHGLKEITPAVYEQALGGVMRRMGAMFGMAKAASDVRACPFETGGDQSCPVQETGADASGQEEEDGGRKLFWTEEGKARLRDVPPGFMRDLTRKRVEAFARREGVARIDNALIDAKYREWGEGSAKQCAQMEWQPQVWERVQRIPDFVRGMVIREVERCAREIGTKIVGQEALDRASQTWESEGTFHSEMFPEQYKK